jgi:periplasmic protein TonB
MRICGHGSPPPIVGGRGTEALPSKVSQCEFRIESLAYAVDPFSGSSVFNARPAAAAPIPNTTAILISKVEPAYPLAARQQKISGTVVLTFNIDATGIPYNIRVHQPLGYGLDQSAIAALSQWKFRPSTINGTPVPTSGMQAKMDFKTY